MRKGRTGESYNIGGENEWTNIDLVKRLCEIAAEETGVQSNEYKDLITYVRDRPGHDRRYAIDCNKIKNELGWQQSVSFEEGLKLTVRWYLENDKWIENIVTGDYRNWIEKNYSER